MIWRDTWEGAPGVVIISVQGDMNGELDAVIVALRLTTLPRHVDVREASGRTLRLRLPVDLAPFSINARQTLTVEAST